MDNETIPNDRGKKFQDAVLLESQSRGWAVCVLVDFSFHLGDFLVERHNVMSSVTASSDTGGVMSPSFRRPRQIKINE